MSPFVPCLKKLSPSPKTIEVLRKSPPVHTASIWNITIQRTSHDDLTEKSAENFWAWQYWKQLKKFVKSEGDESYSNDLTEFAFARTFIWGSFNKTSSNQSGSQIHAWILLKKRFYYIRICSIFCRASPFHREWPQLVTILTSFDLHLKKKFKSLKY